MSPTPRKSVKASGADSTAPRRRKFRFTNGHLDGLRPEPKPYNESDADVPGLSIHVGTSGTKSWWFRYHWKSERKILTLGTYPALGIHAAREMAREARRLINNGVDPSHEQLVKKNALPEADEVGTGRHIIDNLIDEFIEKDITPNRKRPEDVRWQFGKYILPEWRGRNVREIKPKDVRELLFKIADSGIKVTANRVTSLLTQFFLYAVDRDVIEVSPVQLRRKKPGGKESPRQRALSDAELAAYLADPVAATRFRRLAYVISALLATAARRSELVLAKWSDVDLDDERVWFIPKENAKNGEAHLIPLSDFAIEAFRELRKLADAETRGHPVWVLPGTDPTKPVDPKLLTRGVAKCLKRFKTLGIEKFTLHDLRRTCRTGLAKLKIPPHIAELCLNHVQTGIVAVYDVHDYLDEKRAALDAWGTRLNTLKQPKETNTKKKSS